jgi:hypothetical protein
MISRSRSMLIAGRSRCSIAWQLGQILRAGWSFLETRYIVRPPNQSKEVLDCWTFTFTNKLTNQELYDWLISRK